MWSTESRKRKSESMKLMWSRDPGRRDRQKTAMEKMRQHLSPEKKREIYQSENRSRKISEAVTRYAQNPDNTGRLSARWSEERRARQAEVMKRVRSKYYSDPENKKTWHEKVSRAARISGQKWVGTKRPECGHEPWNKGLTKETDGRVRKAALLESKPRSEQGRANIRAACFDKKNKNPEWYRKVCAANRRIAESKRGVPRSVETMRKIMNLRKPTSIERQFIGLIEKHNLPYRYVGNGDFWIGNMNPDFIHNNKSQRMVVELYGDFWHRNHKPEDRIARFAKSNFRCVVIWEHEFKRSDWEQRVLGLLQNQPETVVR